MQMLWRHYLKDPTETNRHINTLNPEMGMEILAYGAKESKRLVLNEVASQNGLGHMSAERWNTLHNQMQNAELIKGNPDNVSAAFNTQFLK